MGTSVALLICFCFILWLFVKDIKRRPKMSGALWIALIWAVIIGSRPVSAWFGYGGGGGDEASAYDSGNPLERNVYLVLMVAGLIILWRRGVTLGAVIRENQWLFIFYLYWAFSVVWSDAPFVAFKRWFKDLGNLVIVLIILTEDDRVEAAKMVFVRCAYLLVPLSLLFIRYLPEWGRGYDVAGNVTYVGVCPNKNTLGTLVLVSGLFFFWDLFNGLRKPSADRDRLSVCARILLLIMVVWIMRIADCATALACTIMGIGVFVALKLPTIRRNLGLSELYLVVGAIAFFALDSAFGLRATVLQLLGRDATLTGRTEVWELLLNHQSNALEGSGFNSFWSGETMREIWKTVPGIIQAHNGYLDTYLNGGVLGVFFLLTWLGSAWRSIKQNLATGSDYAKVQMAFLCIAIVYNWTEAAFNKNGLLWLALLLVTVKPPAGHWVSLATPECVDEEEVSEPISPAGLSFATTIRA